MTVAEPRAHRARVERIRGHPAAGKAPVNSAVKRMLASFDRWYAVQNDSAAPPEGR